MYNPEDTNEEEFLETEGFEGSTEVDETDDASNETDDENLEDQEGLLDGEDGEPDGDEGDDDEKNSDDDENDETDDEGDEDDGQEEVTDEDIVVIPYIDSEGVERNWKIPNSELPELVRLAKYGKDSEVFVQETEKYLATQTAAIKVGTVAMQDNLVQQVLIWKAKGFSDVQIVKGLSTYFSNQGENMTAEEIAQANETGEVDPQLVALFEKQTKPLRDNLERLSYETRVNEAIRRNDDVIARTSAQLGIDSNFAKEDAELFYKEFMALNPKFEQSDVMTPKQYEATLKVSGLFDKYKKQPAKTAEPVPPVKKAGTGAIIKGKAAAPVASAKVTTQPMKKVVNNSNTREARKARLEKAGILW